MKKQRFPDGTKHPYAGGKKFPGFQNCMRMMRSHDPWTQEEGFGLLEKRAGDFVPELIGEFHTEENYGLQGWLIDLIAASVSRNSCVSNHRERASLPARPAIQ